VTFQHYGNVFGAPIARLAGAKRVIVQSGSAGGAMMAPWVVTADRLLGSGSAPTTASSVNSDYTENMFATYPAGYRSRILRIDHGLRGQDGGIGKAEARAELGLPKDVPLLGLRGAPASAQQLDTAIRHSAAAPRGASRPRRAGRGPGPRSRRCARQRRRSARAIFSASLPPNISAKFLAALDCFVFPSCAETFGLAPVEAAQVGLPVVANRLDVLRGRSQLRGRALRPLRRRARSRRLRRGGGKACSATPRSPQSSGPSAGGWADRYR